MARIQLANLYDPPDADDDKPVTSVPPSMPWIQMAHCMTLAGVAHGFVIAQDDQAGVHGTARLIKELNAFLRQTLIQCTVDYHVMKMTSIPQVTPWLPLLYLARDRAIAALDRSNIDPRIVAPATGGQPACWERIRSQAFLLDCLVYSPLRLPGRRVNASPLFHSRFDAVIGHSSSPLSADEGS
ncbi:hypothetical protein RHOSPDRAFT_36756 [Rhodotorula sp. JG-1b]|nr:hypothetical protein RHOSPDRAFT_36756 [Rhodotorula sp. JG-1b]